MGPNITHEASPFKLTTPLQVRGVLSLLPPQGPGDNDDF